MEISSNTAYSLGHDTPEALDYDIAALAERARRMALVYPRSATQLKEAALWLTDVRTETIADVIQAETPLQDDRGDDMIAAQIDNDNRRDWAV